MGGPQLNIPKSVAELSGWTTKGQGIAKTYLFADFRSALDFVNRVGQAAEEQGHHPDLHLAWGKVDVETWTHDAGGLTEKDFKLASEIDRLFLSR